MNRRTFIAALGGAAAWPRVAWGQQSGQLRRIGILNPLAADDSEQRARISAFQQALQQLGWTEDRNVRFDYRSSAGDVADTRKYAAEMVALDPDVILVQGAVNVEALQRATRTIPIVFASLTDPVGAGFVESLA